MSDGSYWQAKKAQAEARDARIEVDRLKGENARLAKALEALADPCRGCLEGLVSCSHARSVRILLGVPLGEAGKIKSYAEWKKANRKADPKPDFTTINDIFGRDMR